jgi:catechol-2,3-dioxygenase
MNIRKIHLQTDDLPGTKKFYHTKLEFEIKEEGKDFISFNAGASELYFEQTKSPANPTYHFAFNIPDNKIDEALEWTARKVEIVDVEGDSKIADFVNWNAKAFYFYDNNGNILEFIARFLLGKPSQSPFSAKSILSISEIGIVTDDVNQTAVDILQNFGIKHFKLPPPYEDFAALGDDEGLFILVTEKRLWYLTNLEAEKHPLQIYFSVSPEEEHVWELNQEL